MKYERQILTVAHWTACVVGTAILVLVAIFAIGEGLPNPFALHPRELLLFAALATMIVGLVVGWKWEGIGGLLILARSLSSAWSIIVFRSTSCSALGC